MSIKTWCIIGMIVVAILGYLRTKNREATSKTLMIKLHLLRQSKYNKNTKKKCP